MSYLTIFQDPLAVLTTSPSAATLSRSAVSSSTVLPLYPGASMLRVAWIRESGRAPRLVSWLQSTDQYRRDYSESGETEDRPCPGYTARRRASDEQSTWRQPRNSFGVSASSSKRTSSTCLSATLCTASFSSSMTVKESSG